MLKKKLMAAFLSAAMVFTMLPIGNAIAEGTKEPIEITLKKNDLSEVNPIGGYDKDGNIIYGGDPSVYVEGDTVYLYEGHDVSKNESYSITEWLCYSTKNLKDWTYEGVIMKEDKSTISWANATDAAWAGQITKYRNKYYFYWCTYDKNHGKGGHSIGVSVSDSPTGPFVDIGKPLVSASITTDSPHDQWADWSDIDPTVWVETVDGVEHRYLCWGNDVNYICELNEDMISVKDINADGKITFGRQVDGATTSTADIISMEVWGDYTEAPWLYRRQNESGEYYGDYYLFCADSWREQMAYATMDASQGLMNGKWEKQGIIMEPTATSDTNHMAVFDFQGKTYFIYHNGSLPGGSGYRRAACIAELHFNEDGSIQYIPETAVGVNGEISVIYTSDAKALGHETYHNSLSDSAYPYTEVAVKAGAEPDSADAAWVLVAGKADTTKASYVSIQSENKPGLYLTANTDGSVTLAHDYKINALEETAKKQTFKTVEGLADKKGVSFESVSQPGQYLTAFGEEKLILTDGSRMEAATFYMNDAPKASTKTEDASANWLEYLGVAGYEVTNYPGENRYAVTVSEGTKSIDVGILLFDEKGYYTIDGVPGYDTEKNVVISAKDIETKLRIKVFAQDGTKAEEYELDVYQGAETKKTELEKADMSEAVITSFGFEAETDGAVAVTKATVPEEVANPVYQYTDGKNGKAIFLDGTYGLCLGDAAVLGTGYTVSFWMKPDTIKSAVDPLFAAGTFSPERWVALTHKPEQAAWSYDGVNFKHTPVTGSIAYKKDEWQNVVFSVDEGTATIYVDGVKSGKGDVSTLATTDTDGKIYFGVNKWDNYYSGALDELVLLNRPVSANEAAVLGKNYANLATGMVYELTTDKTVLQEILSNMNRLDTSQYPTDKAVALQIALLKAKNVIADVNTTKVQVDAAAVSIKQARSQLMQTADVDTTKLDIAIAQAELLNASDYTQESYQTLSTVLLTAKSVRARASLTQEEADAATAELEAALDALEEPDAAVELLHYDMTTSGTVLKDISGNGNDAALVNVNAEIQADNSLYLADNGYIELPGEVFAGCDTLTISIWAKDLSGSANTSAMYIGTKAESTNYPASYWLLNPCNGDSRMKSVITDSENASAPWGTEVGISPTNAAQGVSGPYITGTEWNHYVTVLTKDTITGYLNGNNIGSYTLNRNISDFGDELVAYIGKSPYPDPTFKGYVREVQVFQSAMTDEQVAQLHEETKLTPAIQVSSGDDLAGYLYVCFADTSAGKDVQQIHFFLSQDGLNWTAVNGCLPAYMTGTDYPTANYAFEKNWKLDKYSAKEYYDETPGATGNGAFYNADEIAETISGDASVLFPFEGRDHGLRDPYLIRGSLKDGSDANTIRILATDLNIYDKQYASTNWGRMTSSKEEGDNYDTSGSGGSKQLFIYETKDFVHWDRRTVDVATEIAGGCVWAPEAVYNPEKDNYLVYWSCRVETDGYARNRLYCNETKDFITFGPTKLYEQEAFYKNYGKVVSNNDGYGNIDTSQLWVAEGTNPYGTLYRLVKDETNNHIELMKADTVLDPSVEYDTAKPGEINAYTKADTTYSQLSDLSGLNDYERADVVWHWFQDNSVGNHFTKISQVDMEKYNGAYEGATMFKFIDRDEWCVMIDYYGDNAVRYEPYTTTDLSKADSITKAAANTYGRTGKDVGCHGGIIPITAAEYNQIIKTYNDADCYAQITGIRTGKIRTDKNTAGYVYHDIDTIDYEGSKQEAADKSDLAVAILAAATVSEKDYTPESYEIFANARKKAKAVYMDADASQEQVDAAKTALAEAQTGLEKKQETSIADKAALAEAIIQAASISAEDYTPESYEPFTFLLETAINTYGDALASQKKVDTVTADLVDAQSRLVKKAEAPSSEDVDKEALAIEIGYAKAVIQGDYTPESYEALQKALKHAETVYADANASQEQVDTAKEALSQARENLIKKMDEKPSDEKPSDEKPSDEKPSDEKPSDDNPAPAVDKSGLAAAIDKAQAIYESAYTKESYEALEAALKRAETVNAKADATQQEVSAAAEALEAAYKALVFAKTPEKEPDKTASGKIVKPDETVNAADPNTKQGMTTATTVSVVTDASGISTEKTRIPDLSDNSRAVVTVTTDKTGKVTAAKAAVTQELAQDSYKAVLTGEMLNSLVAASGQENVEILLTVKNTVGDILYRMKVESEDLVPGEDLYIYKQESDTHMRINSKLSEAEETNSHYVLVNNKAYKVKKTGGISIAMKERAVYRLVNEKEAKIINQQIEDTVKLLKSSALLKRGKSTKIRFAKDLDLDNVKSVTYTSSDNSVAAVSKKGKVAAKKSGAAVIKVKVTLKNGITKALNYKLRVK